MNAEELIVVLPQPRHKSQLGNLEAASPREFEAVGYTFFGDLFMRDLESSEVAIAYICPFELVPIAATSLQEAIELFEANPDAKNELLMPDKVDQLIKRLGGLEFEEIYIPCPIPMLGGDGSLESYQKGNLWAHVEFATS